MAKRKSSTDATDAAAPAPETAQEPAAPAPQDREPGVEPPEPARRANWQPRSVITEVLPDGTKAKLIDGYNAGVDVAFESPDPNYRPTANVLEPLKEDRPGHNKFGWKKPRWHKDVKHNPVAERLDAESRFAESVRRQREEQDKDGGKTPF